ncbi:MAG: hypothetical protein IJH64_09850 [Oscillospiraceae bacterium]|nr:hypothetical protein [Oscillospiraceae bacterium]
MKQKNGRQNYDWNKIKLDYMHDPKMSLKKIAEKYGIRLHTVEKRSKADNWYEEKQQYQKSLAAEVTSRVYSTQADLLELELRAVDMTSDIILSATQDPLQFNRHIVYQNGQQVEAIFDVINTKALLDMMKAIKLIVDIKSSILGITSIEHQDRMELARAKLQLDRERFELEKQKSGAFSKDGEKPAIGIVILPEVKDKDSKEAKEQAKILEEWSS